MGEAGREEEAKDEGTKEGEDKGEGGRREGGGEEREIGRAHV